MFVSHHTLKWTRTCRSHGRHPHAHTAHFLLNRHTVAGRPQPMMMTRRLCAAGSRNRNRGNALMREVVEVRRKRPRRRPAAPVEQGEDPVDRPVEAGVFARLGVDKYAGLGAEVAGAFADSKGRYGYRRIKAVLKTGVSEKSVRRIMAEEGLVAHVPKRRRYSSYEGETTPAPANLVDRDFTAERPNEKWLTDISEIKARDGKGVPFAAGRLLRWRDRRIHRRLQPQRGAGQPDAGESGLDAAGERASPGAFRLSRVCC